MVEFMAHCIGHYCTDVTCNHCWAKLCSNNVLWSLLYYSDLSTFCCTVSSGYQSRNVVWHHFCAAMCSDNGTMIQLLFKNTLGHVGCLSPWKTVTDRRTDRDEPIYCSWLKLEHEKHLKRGVERNITFSLKNMP